MEKYTNKNGQTRMREERPDGTIIDFAINDSSTPDPQPEPVTLDQVYEQNLDIMEGSVTTYEQNLQILDMLDKLGGTK